jgi:hypothetical protein
MLVAGLLSTLAVDILARADDGKRTARSGIAFEEVDGDGRADLRVTGGRDQRFYRTVLTRRYADRSPSETRCRVSRQAGSAVRAGTRAYCSSVTIGFEAAVLQAIADLKM